MIDKLARNELPLAFILLIWCFPVEGLISLLIYVVEDIVFNQLVEAWVLPLETLRGILRRFRLY